MKLIIVGVLIVIIIFSARVRCVLLHPFLTVKFLLLDVYRYIRYCRWREYRGYGKLTIFTGLFGHGKTLILSKTARRIYKRYNNRLVYDFRAKKWKRQYINIVSNVQLNDIKFIPLNSLNDMLTYADDLYNDGVSVWLFLVDEMSTQVNSREYKENFTTELLNILLTCRHYRFEIMGTSQRFNHVDALVRQVTSTANECSKLWRLVNVTIYDAWTIENTADVTKIKPRSRKCLFVTDADFNAYDTTAVVENFKENVKQGKIISDKEILEYQNLQTNENTKMYYRRKYRRRL